MMWSYNFSEVVQKNNEFIKEKQDIKNWVISHCKLDYKKLG